MSVEQPLDGAPFGALPAIHFSPRRNWMNDPNGLVFHEGRYHLFFQYNPHDHDHGFMSWGHASSTDLVRWVEHPIALRYDDEAEIYSGSVVWDGRGSAGFGPALVAVYTAHARRRRHQAQCIASSTDAGMTWSPFQGNPVLDRSSGDFRDPKVVRYRGAGGEFWVMVAVEAAERRAVLYRSHDLRTWTYLSDFTAPELGDGIWECPDLFPLDCGGQEVWVMIVSLGETPWGTGSGTVYFTGTFDGERFTAAGGHRRLDHGRDNYAGVTFSGLPEGEAILIGWMGNWNYSRQLPVLADEPRRGMMTLARRLSLAADRQGAHTLIQEAVAPATEAVGSCTATHVTAEELLPLRVPTSAQVTVVLDLGSADGARIRLRHGGEGGGVTVEYRASGEFLLDRTESAPGFPPSFAGPDAMRLAGGRQVRFTLWTDVSSIEVFGDGGASVMTALVGADGGGRVSCAGLGGEVSVTLEARAPRDTATQG